MTAMDREALNALERRLNHAAAIARLISEHADIQQAGGDFVFALEGVSNMLDEAADRLAHITAAATS